MTELVETFFIINFFFFVSRHLSIPQHPCVALVYYRNSIQLWHYYRLYIIVSIFSRPYKSGINAGAIRNIHYPINPINLSKSPFRHFHSHHAYLRQAKNSRIIFSTNQMFLRNKKRFTFHD